MAVARSKFLLPWLEDARNIVDMKLEWNRSMSLSGLQSHLISCAPSAAHDSLMTSLRRRPRPPPPPPLRVQALAVDGVATAEVVKVRLKSR